MVYKDKVKTKDGRQYYFVVSWSHNGKRERYKSKRYLKREECVKAEARFRLELGKSTSQRFTFNEMIDEYLADKRQNAKPTTLNNTEYCLRHTRNALGNVPINKLTNEKWQGFLNYLQEQPMRNHRRNRIIEYTVAVCNFANRRHNVFTAVPSRFDKFNEQADKPLDEKMEFWTPQEFNTFISVVDDLLYSTLFLFLYGTGMRSGEALALTWNDINFEKGTISISKTVNTKLKGKGFTVLPPKTKSSIRTIRAPQIVCERLLELSEHSFEYAQNIKEAFIFGGERPIPNSTLQHAKHRYYLKAKEIEPSLQEIRIHSLRHSCASALISSGATIVYVSKYLGHSSVKETLDTYSHFMPNESEVIASAMNDILKKGT